MSYLSFLSLLCPPNLLPKGNLGNLLRKYMNWKKMYIHCSVLSSPALWKEAHKTSVQDLSSTVNGEMF